MNRPVQPISVSRLSWEPQSPAITVEITLRATQATRLVKAAERRKKLPEDVLTSVVTLVLRDDLIDAILDDGAGAGEE